MECRRYANATVTKAAQTTNESIVVMKYITRTVASSKLSDINLRKSTSKLILQSIGSKGTVQPSAQTRQRSRVDKAHAGGIAEQAIVDDIGKAPGDRLLDSRQPNRSLHRAPEPPRQRELCRAATLFAGNEGGQFTNAVCFAACHKISLIAPCFRQ